MCRYTLEHPHLYNTPIGNIGANIIYLYIVCMFACKLPLDSGGYRGGGPLVTVDPKKDI